MDKNLLIAVICFSLGLASFLLALISSISQYYSICKTNNTSNSIVTYIIFWVCSMVCLSWCFIFYLNNATIPLPKGVPLWLRQWELIPLILAYMLDFILLTSIIIVKMHHMNLSKKLNMNELQLADYLTKKKRKDYLHNKRKFWKYPYFSMILTFTIAFIILFVFVLAFVILGPEKDYDVHFDQDVIMIVIPALSIVGAIVWEAISWPQFIISLKTKNTSGISLGWAIFFPCACVVSFAYSLSLAFISGDFTFNSIGGIVFSGMLVNFGVLILKIINIQKAKKHGMTEIEYTQKVLIPMYEKKQAAKKAKKQKRA